MAILLLFGLSVTGRIIGITLIYVLRRDYLHTRVIQCGGLGLSRETWLAS